MRTYEMNGPQALLQWGLFLETTEKLHFDLYFIIFAGYGKWYQNLVEGAMLNIHLEIILYNLLIWRLIRE